MLLDAEPEHVVTLGQEPWNTLARLPGVEASHPARALSRDPALYGAEGAITIRGRRIPWTPLAHPGLLHHAGSAEAGSWAYVHDEWCRRGVRHYR